MRKKVGVEELGPRAVAGYFDAQAVKLLHELHVLLDAGIGRVQRHTSAVLQTESLSPLVAGDHVQRGGDGLAKEVASGSPSVPF